MDTPRVSYGEPELRSTETSDEGTRNVPPQPPPQIVTIGGRRIQVVDTNVAPENQGPMYKQEDRDTLSSEQKNTLFKDAVRGISVKYDFTAVDLTSEKRLEEIHLLSVLINKTRSAHVQYDLHDVFLIVFPANNTARLEQKDPVDLYTHYEEVSVEQVASSCQWYRSYTVKDYWRDNLTLTYHQLENSMATRLFNKCYEKYETYPENQRGGPLLFIIMMKQLVSNSEEAVSHLKKLISTMKISEVQGEDVSKVISLLRGANKHLRFINKVPEDFGKQILKILQTSSVTEFNEYWDRYATMVRQAKSVAMYHGQTVDEAESYNVDMLLDLAQEYYNDLKAAGTWFVPRGTKTSAFQGEVAPTTTRKAICWNCGEEGHPYPHCPRPLNEQRIADSKAKHRQQAPAPKTRTTDGNGGNNAPNQRGNNSRGGQSNRGSSTANTSKFRPPTAGENNRRVIDGKHMFYLHRTRRWVRDRAHSSNQTAAETPAFNNASTTQANLPAPPADAPNQVAIDAAMANAQRAFETAMRGLVNQFQS